MVATTGTDGEGLARVGLDGGVTQVLANGTFAAETSLRPMVWNGGIYVIARTDGGEVWELDVMRHSARDTGVRLCS